MIANYNFVPSKRRCEKQLKKYERSSVITNGGKMIDIRDELFSSLMNKKYLAELIVERKGILSGIKNARDCFKDMEAELEFLKKDGDRVEEMQCICRIIANPKNIALIEEKLIGTISKYSGISTAANYAVKLANNKVKIVSGSWKKMPPEIKNNIREAIVTGGASFRILDSPMLYLDKNYINMFGSIPDVLKEASKFNKLNKVVQIRGMYESIEEETRQAIKYGANVLMVDTGDLLDLEKCKKELEKIDKYKEIKVAYAGNVKLDNIKFIVDNYAPDILCIGKEIVDAPILDMKINVIKEKI